MYTVDTSFRDREDVLFELDPADLSLRRMMRVGSIRDLSDVRSIFALDPSGSKIYVGRFQQGTVDVFRLPH
jgi:hypothetical protein